MFFRLVVDIYRDFLGGWLLFRGGVEGGVYGVFEDVIVLF